MIVELHSVDTNTAGSYRWYCVCIRLQNMGMVLYSEQVVFKTCIWLSNDRAIYFLDSNRNEYDWALQL